MFVSLSVSRTPAGRPMGPTKYEAESYVVRVCSKDLNEEHDISVLIPFFASY